MPGGEQWRRRMAAETTRQAKVRRSGGYKRCLRQDKWRNAQPVVIIEPPKREEDEEQ